LVILPAAAQWCGSALDAIYFVAAERSSRHRPEPVHEVTIVDREQKQAETLQLACPAGATAMPAGPRP